MTIDDATRAQNDAASPDISTWLSANAGSGKTRVLTDRVARLLLGGADPQSILCLTYTKAAAGEMQNRLFQRLGEWAMLPDADLRKALGKIGEAPPEVLSHARTLFARAIETPGGLKIQTIHSFCSALLRQFPLEAGVSPAFRELDERGQEALIEDLLNDLADSVPDVLERVAHHYSGETFSDLAKEIVSTRTAFGTGHPDDAIRKAFGLPDGLTLDILTHRTISTDDIRFLKDAAAILVRNGSKTDQALGAKMLQLTDDPSIESLTLLEGCLLYGSGARHPFGVKTGSIPTKSLQSGAFAGQLVRFNEIIDRVADARPLRVALISLEKTKTLHDFAQHLLPAYANAKNQTGALDFDDLIDRARTLLKDRSYEWVLYRLDARIDHILVDEAQDTSPPQWDVIGALAQEIAAGEGARQNVPRSFFVVGDKKQSIYSFQGADARAFDAMADHFKDRMKAGMARRELLHSFRSSPAILHAVDCTFRDVGHAALGPHIEHLAIHPDRPGRVDLWPLEERDKTEAPPDWFEPVDRVSADDPAVKLADRVAETIKNMIATGTIPDENSQDGAFRRITSGDFLILVQRRSELFHQIIRACKSRELPMAGADRLKISATLAVKDLTALLSFLALPEDDLSLAAALKSPLFGWDEQALFSLASGRGTAYLWTALRNARDRFPETIEQLDELRRLADFERPYELLDAILSRFGGRKKLIARLGQEAEDGIDELLSHALRFEQQAVPSLTGFLAELGSQEFEIKRATDTSAGLIQVMTIHGAKGLERPIVILPETIRGDARSNADVIVTQDGLPVWSEAADRAPDVVTRTQEAAKAADREERQRLLYVAMTRAKSWLIVAGIAPGQTSKSPQWHDMVQAGLERAGATWIEEGDQRILRLEFGDWAWQPTAATTADSRPEEVATTEWTELPIPASKPTEKPVSPSDLGGAKALPGEGGQDEEQAKSKGTAIHLLLEHLPNYPEDRWDCVARRLLGGICPPDTTQAYLSEARACINEYPEFFTTDTLAELEIVADLPTLGRRLDGTLDRVLIDDAAVHILDYKTNAVVPETPDWIPEGILRQLGAYLEAATAIWPGKSIRLAILWTANATAMTVPHELMTAALSRAAKP